MKRVIALMSVFLIGFLPVVRSSPANSGHGINFTETSLASAIKLAKEQHKLIFIDIYATLCGPCTKLKLRTFPNKDAGDFFNANFINLSFDGEKGEGLQLFQAYRLNAFPTLIILNSDGTPLLGTEGYMDAKTLIAFGKAAIEKQQK